MPWKSLESLVSLADKCTMNLYLTYHNTWLNKLQENNNNKIKILLCISRKWNTREIIEPIKKVQRSTVKSTLNWNHKDDSGLDASGVLVSSNGYGSYTYVCFHPSKSLDPHQITLLLFPSIPHRRRKSQQSAALASSIVASNTQNFRIGHCSHHLRRWPSPCVNKTLEVSSFSGWARVRPPPLGAWVSFDHRRYQYTPRERLRGSFRW